VEPDERDHVPRLVQRGLPRAELLPALRHDHRVAGPGQHRGSGPLPGGNVPGADLSVCAIRPNSQQGGNPRLQPETSKQWSVGFVFQPVQWASGSLDLWEIKRQDLVYELTPQQVLANYTTFPNSLVRGANGRLDDPGGYIRAGS
jgi:iron complex outermembrane receptor protein